MELLHLRYFVAVAEELNFSAAARRLHMATSPLSRQIRNLERELGHQLFDRDTHHVTLTPAGTALVPLAQEMLEQANSLQWRLNEAVRPRLTTVFLGMPDGVHPLLRARVNALTERVHERFELKRWPGSTSALVTAVHEGKLALTLARLPVSDPALDQLHVMSEQLGALMPADQFAGQDSVSLTELTDLPYVEPPKELRPAYFDLLDRELREHGIKKRINLSESDTGYRGVYEVVSSGMGFSISIFDPESPMRGYQVEGIAALPFTDFHPHLDTALLWRRDRAEGGDLGELIEAAREVFTDRPIHT
ncbi:LysR family transcriptional regulator [Streptomyces sp. NPDC088253]|uniref:LysR family transcriptional regulator n=1 Tax=Streptomyces sp. NPDC088253 TaxID=3365846 RepID=UPI003830240A